MCAGPEITTTREEDENCLLVQLPFRTGHQRSGGADREKSGPRAFSLRSGPQAFSLLQPQNTKNSRAFPAQEFTRHKEAVV